MYFSKGSMQFTNLFISRYNYLQEKQFGSISLEKVFVLTEFNNFIFKHSHKCAPFKSELCYKL